VKHPRQLIREHIARELVRRGAWGDSVFVNRVTNPDEDDPWPHICVYTQSERTADKLNNDTRRQDLQVLIEVRSRREPDMVRPFPRVDGLPNHPTQVHPADQTLDDACLAVEQIVFGLFGRPGNIKLDDQQIDFDGINEINTDISGTAEGLVPHMQAQIEFRFVYWACTPGIEPDTCPLTRFFGEAWPTPCKDPFEKPVPIGLLVDGDQTPICTT
jgi:hypothetical protein